MSGPPHGCNALKTTFAILHCSNRWSWHVRCNQCSSSRCGRSEGGFTGTLLRHKSARSPELADTNGEVDGTPELSCGQIRGGGGKSDGGGAQAWINQVLQDIEVDKSNPFDDCANFKVVTCAAFEPVIVIEESRRQLPNLCQTGRVRMYVQCFHELQYKLPGTSEEDAFLTFLAGLAPHIQEQVRAHIQGDLSAAITMGERLDLFHASAWEGGGSSGRVQQKGQRGGSVGKKKGLVHSMEEKKEGTSEVGFVKEKGKRK